MGQRLVDGGFDIAVEAQRARGAKRLSRHDVRQRRRHFIAVERPVVDVVVQHLLIPLCERLLAAEVLEHRLAIGPAVAPLAAHQAGRHAFHQRCSLDEVEGIGAPATQDGRVQQHHATGKCRMPRRTHQAQESAQRVTDQEHRLTDAIGSRLREVGQLLHQVRPVVGDGVLRVVPELLDCTDREAAIAQAVEHHPVGAGRKAVAMRKHNRWHGACAAQRGQISFSSGVEIFFSTPWRCAGIISGCWLKTLPSHTGSSMLSNTSRSFWPQLLCIIR